MWGEFVSRLANQPVLSSLHPCICKSIHLSSWVKPFIGSFIYQSAHPSIPHPTSILHLYISLSMWPFNHPLSVPNHPSYNLSSVCPFINHLIIYLFFHLCMCSSVHSCNQPFRCHSTHTAPHPAINLFHIPSVCPSIFYHPSICLSTRTTNQPTTNPSIHSSIHLISVSSMVFVFQSMKHFLLLLWQPHTPPPPHCCSEI